MNDTVFRPHDEDPLPLHRNVPAVADCPVRPAQVGGKSCSAVEVPILTCASIWYRCQKEAEEWIAPGGKPITDAIARNRRINTAYAQLWQADHRFQWAGLAAFASKQVGCGLLHAAHNSEAARRDLRAMQMDRFASSSTEAAATAAVPLAVTAFSEYVARELGIGNLALFLDIYPLHRFYMLRGLKHLKTCLPERRKIADKAIWPVSRKTLEFGKPFQEILAAFEMIENNAIADSVRRLAYHEQINILQPVIYDDADMRRALNGNQLSWVTNFPGGVASAIELTLSSECSIRPGPWTISFPRKITAKLYDPDQRMPFVNEAADRFDKLLHTADRVDVERSIANIAAHGGALP